MADPIGEFLRVTPAFTGKRRLREFWSKRQVSGDIRVGKLPDGSLVEVDMGIPYEQMVWLGLEEYAELQYLMTKLAPGEIFVDVGSNIGLWTLVGSRAVGNTGQVISFEPNPGTFSKLKRNLGHNGATNVLALQKAVSNSEGAVPFSCRSEHNNSAISASASPGAIQVEATTLDSLINLLGGGRISGIKLDTEGHELASIQGAASVIDRFSPWLIVELNSVITGVHRLRDWPVYELLAEKGYRPGYYSNSVRDERPAAPDEYLDGYRNVLFSRRSAGAMN